MNSARMRAALTGRFPDTAFSSSSLRSFSSLSCCIFLRRSNRFLPSSCRSSWSFSGLWFTRSEPTFLYLFNSMATCSSFCFNRLCASSAPMAWSRCPTSRPSGPMLAGDTARAGRAAMRLASNRSLSSASFFSCRSLIRNSKSLCSEYRRSDAAAGCKSSLLIWFREPARFNACASFTMRSSSSLHACSCLSCLSFRRLSCKACSSAIREGMVAVFARLTPAGGCAACKARMSIVPLPCAPPGKSQPESSLPSGRPLLPTYSWHCACPFEHSPSNPGEDLEATTLLLGGGGESPGAGRRTSLAWAVVAMTERAEATTLELRTCDASGAVTIGLAGFNFNLTNTEVC
mmetsp:Transcript_72209/g.182024  ORF Transcript_72209/g.182024 Transcript_72209/m.182024 type:complete len:346 (-) Transcript_72209:1137-2174(-)